MQSRAEELKALIEAIWSGMQAAQDHEATMKSSADELKARAKAKWICEKVAEDVSASEAELMPLIDRLERAIAIIERETAKSRAFWGFPSIMKTLSL